MWTAERFVVVPAARAVPCGKLLELQFLFYDLVQLGGTAIAIVRVGVRDLQLMQLLATAGNGRARWRFGIRRLRWLRDESPHQFTSFANNVNFHDYNQSCRFKL